MKTGKLVRNTSAESTCLIVFLSDFGGVPPARAPRLPLCVAFHSLFTPGPFCTCQFLSTAWLLNPPECMEDSFDIRRKDRLLRRGPVSLEPGGINGLWRPFCAAGSFSYYPFFFFFFSPPLVSPEFKRCPLEVPPHWRVHTKHGALCVEALSRIKSWQTMASLPAMDFLALLIRSCCCARTWFPPPPPASEKRSRHAFTVKVIIVSAWRPVPPEFPKAWTVQRGW